jgi:hypothetical protein
LRQSSRIDLSLDRRRICRVSKSETPEEDLLVDIVSHAPATTTQSERREFTGIRVENFLRETKDVRFSRSTASDRTVRPSPVV